MTDNKNREMKGRQQNNQQKENITGKLLLSFADNLTSLLHYTIHIYVLFVLLYAFMKAFYLTFYNSSIQEILITIYSTGLQLLSLKFMQKNHVISLVYALM